ncbi:protein YddE [Thermosipho africanus TCF52B]|jgi:PhzF family phenazine biosynthesis protein|uniref:Protein YddE n=1 Tax=Thermosipho africanus (strain TCF52B) TaxID=484019 RepID=B7IHB8_THEAB|nr:PhzF family phenazine biosynthesis protein [Thermosipho africanus]ACJ75482.1 protein YddE [Thermosipho africanus TCF52B]
MNFYVVDAFANDPFKGNPAGVVILKEDIPKSIKQLIASEVKFSETAFIKKISENYFKIEYFTPVSEIDLCGHATIATFYVLKEKNLVFPNNKYNLHTNVGKLTILIENDLVLMEQAKPELGKVYDKETIAEILGINSEELDERFKLQASYTGLWDLLIPIKKKETLLKLEPNLEKIKEFTKENNIVSFHLFTLDEKEALANTRDFAPLYGINEEAATGTANGALLYYLYKNNLIDEKKVYKIIQGESMNRKSEIFGKIENEKVFIGGKAKIIIEGNLKV